MNNILEMIYILSYILYFFLFVNYVLKDGGYSYMLSKLCKFQFIYMGINYG